MNSLTLYFSGDRALELVRTDFYCSLFGERLQTERGKGNIGAFKGSFQWTQGVQAVAILVLKTLLSKTPSESEASLSGSSSSAASSLDYALSKPPTWMLDMFGCSSSGEPIVRRLFKRVNPEQKLPGPVSVSLNLSFLPQTGIKIFINDTECRDKEKLSALVDALETNWRPARVSLSSRSNGPCINLPSFESQVSLLKSAFESEISHVLGNSEIFTAGGVRRISQRMNQDISLAGLSSPKNRALFSEFVQAKRSSRDRFGFIEKEFSLLSDLTVAVPIGVPSALAIFSKIKLSYPIQVDFAYQHALELMHLILRNELDYTPELIVLGTAPAAIFSEVCHTFGYRPLMLLPGMTHRVLKPKKRTLKTNQLKVKRTAHNFLMLNDDPSTSSMYFQRLKAEKKFSSQLLKITHAEPDEVFNAFATGDEDLRSVLYFPYYEMNRVFNGSELVDTPKDISNIKDSVLFIHESADTDPLRTRALERVIRDSWLTLRQSPSEVKATVNSLFAQRQFTKYLERSSGLF